MSLSALLRNASRHSCAGFFIWHAGAGEWRASAMESNVLADFGLGGWDPDGETVSRPARVTL